YGAMGLGRLKPAGSGNVIFDADYRLSEVGLAYTHALGMDRFVRAVNFTLGYRMQALTSKEAFGAQDGRDLTQGLTLGLFASF
ncbi:MAG: hypothetical protein Q8M96_11145, partial [Rubrivivax sp.]|nr:hypothetical protein [Rubrivivax sp.]